MNLPQAPTSKLGLLIAACKARLKGFGGLGFERLLWKESGGVFAHAIT